MNFIIHSLLAVALFLTACQYSPSQKAKKMIEAMKSDKLELEAIKVEWIETSSFEARLIAYFEEVTITTYFKKTNRKNFFHNINPTRQEFVYHPTQQVFTSSDWESRLWDDGVSGYSFRYENLVIKDLGKKFGSAFVTINDNFGCTNFEARYTLYAV